MSRRLWKRDKAPRQTRGHLRQTLPARNCALAPQMTGRCARLEANKAFGQLTEEGQHTLALECLGDDHSPNASKP